MNIRLDDSIRDVVGKTGMKIIEAILQGERDTSKRIKVNKYKKKCIFTHQTKIKSGFSKNSFIVFV